MKLEDSESKFQPIHQTSSDLLRLYTSKLSSTKAHSAAVRPKPLPSHGFHPPSAVGPPHPPPPSEPSANLPTSVHTSFRVRGCSQRYSIGFFKLSKHRTHRDRVKIRCFIILNLKYTRTNHIFRQNPSGTWPDCVQIGN